MKISQKLILGFLIPSLLLGISEYLQAQISVQLESNVSRVTESSLYELQSATGMSLAAKAIQAYTHQLLISAPQEDTQDPRETEAIINEFQKNINQEIAKFEEWIQLSYPASHFSNQNLNSYSILEELLVLQSLGELQQELEIYKQYINQYLEIVQTNPSQANLFLTSTLEPYFKEQFFPLIESYRIDTEASLIRESEAIKFGISKSKNLQFAFTLAIVLLIIGVGLLISRSILKSILKLQTAVTEFGKGNLETRVQILAKDEIGFLAKAFNQMATYLSQSTVSKTYVDNIIRSMAHPLIITDADLIITTVNQATLNLLGYQTDELVGHSIAKIFAQSVETCEWFSQVGVTQVTSVETNYLAKNGKKIPVLFSSSLLQSTPGKLQGTVCSAQDITIRKQAEEALRQSEERYALAAQGANDGLWDWDLKTHVVYFSPRWKSMLGYEESEIENHLNEWFSRVHPEDLEPVKAELTAHVSGLTSHFEHEHRMLHRNGTYCWMLCRGIAVRNAEGNAYRMAGSQTDITKRKVAETQLRHEALHDSLTHLPNRNLFMAQLGQVVELSKYREDFLFAVLFLDLDRFKVINDSLGHLAGDQLLIAIARRLEKCLRSGDLVARLGGDEFAVLLQNVGSEANTIEIAARIQKALNQPYTLGGHVVSTTVSIGIALNTAGYEQPETFLRDADTAMYRAKSLGKARYEIFDQKMHTQAFSLLQLENDLRWAIERQELRVVYQPIVSLASSKVIGFEALVRWQHPQRGFISPVDFIPIAEDTGLIVPLGHWVLQQACQQMQAWQEQFPNHRSLTINVNLSSKQFTQPNLLEQITAVLQETQLPAKSLKLEITESVIMENAEFVASMLTRLRSLGIQLAIDDFGTGYSSLSYLHRFPIDTLKIDRSFVDGVDVDGEKLEIIRTITTLAWNLGMDIVAEGVETKTQLAQLKALRCECAQGYYFSKPLPGDAATDLIPQKFQ